MGMHISYLLAKAGTHIYLQRPMGCMVSGGRCPSLRPAVAGTNPLIGWWGVLLIGVDLGANKKK